MLLWSMVMRQFSADDMSLYFIKSSLMPRFPSRELLVCSFVCEWCQDTCEVRELGKKVGDILDETEKGTNISGGFGPRPVEDVFDFLKVSFNTTVGDVVSHEIHFGGKQV